VGNLFQVDDLVEVVGLAVRINAHQATGLTLLIDITFTETPPGSGIWLSNILPYETIMDEWCTALTHNGGGLAQNVPRNLWWFVSRNQIQIDNNYYSKYAGIPRLYQLYYPIPWPPFKEGILSRIHDWDELVCHIAGISWGIKAGESQFTELVPDEDHIIATSKNLFDPKAQHYIEANPNFIPQPGEPPFIDSPDGQHPSFPVEYKRDLFLFYFDKVRLRPGLYSFILERTNSDVIKNAGDPPGSVKEQVFFYKTWVVKTAPGIPASRPIYETIPELPLAYDVYPLGWGASYYKSYSAGAVRWSPIFSGMWPFEPYNPGATTKYSPDPDDPLNWKPIVAPDIRFNDARPFEFQLFISPTYLLDAKYVRRYFQGILEESTKKSIQFIDEQNFPHWNPSCNTIISETVTFVSSIPDYDATLYNSSNQDKTHCLLTRNGVPIPDTYWSFVDEKTIRLLAPEYDSSAIFTFEYEALVQAVFELDISTLEEIENLFMLPYADVFVGGRVEEKNITTTEMVKFDSYGRGVLQHVSNNNVGDVSITKITPLGKTIIPISAIQRLDNDQIVIDPTYYSTDAYYSVQYVALITETGRFADYRFEVSGAIGMFWSPYIEWDAKSAGYVPTRFYFGGSVFYVPKWRVRITFSNITKKEYVFLRSAGMYFVSPQAWDIKSA
jgi:hypothetical protein